MKKERISGKKFNEFCHEWSDSKEYNLLFLKAQQNYFNDILAIRGHVFLNEVYDALGMSRTKNGHLSGWLLGDGLVNFEVTEMDDEIELAFDVIVYLHEIAFEIEA